jgi:putative ABC transport system ATP-binding protein
VEDHHGQLRLVGMSAVLEARDLYRFFHAGDDETLALRGVTLDVDAGEIVAITGPSGSGKSTLLACLAGLDEPDGGMVTVAGHPISRRPEVERAALRARLIGVLFQSRNLLDDFNVAENIAIAQRIAGRHDTQATAELLERLGLAQRRQHLPRTLSGGETARAGLAVALANNPAAILADEPTGELDSETAKSIVDLLRERADAGAAVLVVTHDAAMAASADREIHLHDGSVAE